jgi:uncharacterized protein (DUF362 family)
LKNKKIKNACINRNLSRREFLKCIGGGVLLAGSASCIPHVEGSWESCEEELIQGVSTPLSHRVVEVAAESVIDNDSGVIAQDVVVEMISQGLLALTEQPTLEEAWKIILPDYQAGEKISFKANALSSKAPTRPEVLFALTNSLSGNYTVAAEDMFIWDRSEIELEKAGILPSVVGVACRGTHKSGEDLEGVGYQEEYSCLSGRKIRFTRLLTQQTDHLINVAVMKNHFAAKFTGCMKNHYGSFPNPEDFHDDSDIHIARLNAMQEVTKVSRLFVMDAILGICYKDTDRSPDCVPRRILVSFDPVAIDKRGVEIRDEMRAEIDLEPGGQPGYLAEGENLGLGKVDYELVKITV